MGIVFTFAQANSRILCKFFNKKAFALECYFRYNNSSISLQKGQTFLPTAKLVDYILRSQPFYHDNRMLNNRACILLFMKEYFMGGNIMYDVVIVGAGPGGIFTAYELLEKRPDLSIAVFEMGNELTKRHCPIDGDKVKSCIHCKNCSIMSGFGGAGAFSDGKYNITNDFGGHYTNILVKNLHWN